MPIILLSIYAHAKAYSLTHSHTHTRTTVCTLLLRSIPIGTEHNNKIKHMFYHTCVYFRMKKNKKRKKEIKKQ